MRSKKALKNFILWTSLAIITNIIIYIFWGEESALEFLGGYVVELSLSMDNLFLFLVIFSSFRIPVQFQQRVLNYGIIGAMVLRMLFIFLGVSVINLFHWILYIFGMLLIISGLKILLGDNSEVNIEENKLLKVLKRVIPFTNQLYGEKFFVKIDKVLYGTPLFLILLFIEFSDVIFALDSIPAIFAITTNPWIVYSSNIFAILGLRSLYFVLVKLNNMFKYVKVGVGLVLVFTGIKLSVLFLNITIPTIISLMIIFIILLMSLLFSLILD